VYSFTHKPVLDHLEGLQYSDYLCSSPPAVIACHLEYSTDDGVARGRSCFVTRFRLWNAVSLCNNSEFIRIFRFLRHVAFNRIKYIAHYRYEKNVVVLIMSRVLDFE